ncbi:hypothetical protein C8R43DRAFT_122006 [Mycena crocata]|nr:hypothetical protein C8R43DRAFT_122006 [Mycena crocata]
MFGLVSHPGMSLSLPIEELSRLKVTFRVVLLNVSFSFHLSSSESTVSPSGLGDVRLHFRATYDPTGAVCLTVGASERIETQNDDDPHFPIVDIADPDYFGVLLATAGDSFNSTQASDSPILASGGGRDLEFHATAEEFNDTHSMAYTPFSKIPGEFYDPRSFLVDWPCIFSEEVDNPSSGTGTPGTRYHGGPILRRHTITAIPIPIPLRIPGTVLDQRSGNGFHPHSSLTFASAIHYCRARFELATSLLIVTSEYHAPCSPPPDPARPFKCLQADCPKLWFKRVDTRRVHMHTHRPSGRKFPCTFDGCGMSFSRKHDRLRHEVGSHGLGTQWHCSLCNKYFSSEHTLERHRLEKHVSFTQV